MAYSKEQLDQASVAVGMITHTTSHASVRSELRSGKLQKSTNIWSDTTKAPKELVMETLEHLAADPMAWDAVGQRSGASFDKEKARDAVFRVAIKPTEEKREKLQQISAAARPPEDLATPEQALAARQARYGRAM